VTVKGEPLISRCRIDHGDEIMEEFYLHLPSNVQTNSENNRIHRYITTFSDTLELGRNWEVGLTAISYTYGWYNVKPGCIVSIKSFSGDGTRSPMLRELYDIPSTIYDRSVSAFLEYGFDDGPRLKQTRPFNHNPKPAVLCMFYLIPGHYQTLKALVDHINKQVQVHYQAMLGVNKSYPILELHESLGRIRMVSGRAQYEHPNDDKKYRFDTFICIEDADLAAMLGTPPLRQFTDMKGLLEVNTPLKMKHNHGNREGHPQAPDDKIWFDFQGMTDDEYGPFDEASYVYMFPNVVDMSAGIRALCVYSDIVDLTMVGDSRVNLLRTVPIPRDAKFMDQIDMEFMRVHYIPVTKTEMRNIEVYIKDESGADLEFQLGRVILTLHFRKRDTPLKGLSNE
jgi:hypothetical protein